MGSFSPFGPSVTMSSREELSPHHDIVVEWQGQKSALVLIKECENTIHTLTTLKNLNIERNKLSLLREDKNSYFVH